jgi:hypothetical protein
MRLFLPTLLKFLACCALGYGALLFIWGSLFPDSHAANLSYRPASSGHLYTRIREARATHDVDLLFLGSSHAYRGFDPRIFHEAGIRTFNLGSSSQTPLQTRILLNRYLDQLNPEQVIFEVYPVTFELDGVESGIDLIANDRKDVHLLKMSAEINHPLVWNTLLYGGMRAALGLDENLIEPVTRKDDTYIPGGFVEKTREYYQPVSQPLHTWNINDDQWQAFQECLEMLRSRDIKYKLVYAPVTDSLYYSYARRAAFDSLMASCGPYVNFNTRIALSDSLHYYDKHHLNQDGVTLFNRALMESLKSGDMR